METESPTTTAYLTADRLGSPRINTDGSGGVVARHDYLPFGEEITSSITSQRTTTLGYVGSDGIRKQFTGYERDNESNLDFAEARMYAKHLGRFTGADGFLSSGKPSSPQTWNRYIYTTNRPLSHLDPLGLYICNAGKTKCDQFESALIEAKNNLVKIAEKYKDKGGKNSKEYKRAERALNAYGAKGVNNGVFIESKPGLGVARVTVESGSKSKINPSGQRIIVSFDEETFTNQHLDITVAHEGSHVYDGSEWAKNGFKKNKQPSAYQSESDAYTIDSLMAEAKEFPSMTLLIETNPDDPLARYKVFPPEAEIWNASWAPADVEKLRQVGIDRYLEHDKNYLLTPKKGGNAFTK